LNAEALIVDKAGPAENARKVYVVDKDLLAANFENKVASFLPSMKRRFVAGIDIRYDGCAKSCCF